MKRVGFTMKLVPGAAEEYRQCHDELWPELAEQFDRAGIRDYVIYLDSETDTLFASQWVTDENTKAALRATELMRRWWRALSHLMQTNPDDSPIVHPLVPLFELHFDETAESGR